MSFIGDLERLFAQLYPIRVPIAIGVLAVVAIGVAIGWRRGWHRAAARHPRLTGFLVVAAIVIGGPVAWVLGSPLFIRTEAQEAAPVANEEPAPGGAPGAVSMTGQFMGADEFHFGMGTARLIETEDGRHVLRFEDFSVRNGPDLYVYLSNDPDGYEDGAVELGLLKATDGSFNYDIPAGVDVSRVRSAVIWCRAFAVQFAHATLGPAT